MHSTRCIIEFFLVHVNLGNVDNVTAEEVNCATIRARNYASGRAPRRSHQKSLSPYRKPQEPGTDTWR